jgi:mannose-6-phosphate isomerase-like protein (cupin superfamily)
VSAGPSVVWMPGGIRTEIHLCARDTDGAFCLLVDEPPAGWSLPAHLHHGMAETVHVVEGDFEMTIAGNRAVFGAGQTAHVPAGTIHTSSNLGATPGRRIVIFSPAGMEAFFLEAGAPSPETDVDLQAMLALAVRHGWEFVQRGDRD